MPTLIEPNIHRVWLAKQSAKGTLTATTAMVKSPKLMDGSVVGEFDFGSDSFSDGTVFGDQQTYLNSITGAGAPALMMDPDITAYLSWLFHGAETVSVAGTNNVQTGTMTGTPTGGSVRLTYDGRKTATIAYNAINSAVQTALEALPNIGTGGVTVTGGPWPATAMVVTFAGSFTQKRPHPTITLAAADNALTGGTTPTVAFAQTTPGVNATHQTIGSGTSGHYLTWCQSVGSETPDKKRFGDGRIGALTFSVSRGTPIGRVTPGLLFEQPLLNYSTDPTNTQTPFQGFVWTEGQGGWVVNGRTFTGATAFELSLNLDLSFLYGDRATPHATQRGTPGVTITQTVTFDSDMQAEWNYQVYGTETPSVGQAPLSRAPLVGTSTSNMLKKDSSNNTIGSFAHNIPGVQWEIPNSPSPALGAGSQEVTLTGRLSRLSGQNPYEVLIGNQSAAYTV